jgi:hypothetical protein
MPAPQGYSARTLREFISHDFGGSAPIGDVLVLVID